MSGLGLKDYGNNMLYVLIGIVILFFILRFLPNSEPDSFAGTHFTSKPCRGHKWEEVEQPGMEDDEGRPTMYLRCAKCNKTLKEILFD
jgi:hypothetical protein